MADDFRNFRSYYYDKVGFRGVEEKKSLEMLLNEKPLNLQKLSQFCLRFSLPTMFREYIWNILLGVLPQNPESHTFVRDHQEQQYKDLHHCLEVISVITIESPLPLVLTLMILLDEGDLRLNHEQQMMETNSQCLLSLATTFTQMCSHHSRAYFLLKHFWYLVKHNSSNINIFFDKFIHALKQEDPELYQHLHSVSALNNLPIAIWFSQCFAEVLPENSLERIWDKIIAGSVKILVNIAVSLFTTLRRSLLNLKSSADILKFLKELPEETADRVVNNALDSWYQTNANLSR